jgi:predicted Zn-dependent protease
VYSALASVWLRLAERGDPSALGKALEASRLAAASVAPGSSDLLLYGRALLLSGDLDAAAQVLRESVERFPVDQDAFLYLATASERLGRLDQARRALASHVALSPDDRRVAAGASRLGDLSMRAGDAAEAARWFTRAAQLEPNDAMLLVRLARAQVEAGEHAAARRTLDRAHANGASSSSPAFREVMARLESTR